MADASQEDHGPMLLGVSWALTSLATVFLALRVYCKLSTGRRLWWDDFILIAGWITILGVDAVTTVLITRLGLGKHAPLFVDATPVELTLLLSSRATLTITATVWTKTAFAVTLLRLTQGATKALVWFIIVTINVAMGFSAAISWIQCIPLDKWWDKTLDGACWEPQVGVNIWIATAAYSGAADFVLAAIPWTFLPGLTLAKREKVGIAVAMSMGIIAGSVAIVKCVQLPVLETGDSFSSVGMYVWDITESTATIIAACIPALRLLIRSNSTRLYVTPSLPYNMRSRQTPRKTTSRDPFVLNKRVPVDGDGAGLGEYEMESSSTGNSRPDRRRVGLPWS